jgi:signal transduction histidine kinase
MIGYDAPTLRPGHGPDPAGDALPRFARQPLALKAGMHPNSRHPRPLPAGDELIDALRQYVHERAPQGGPLDPADAELALLQLQKLVTLGQITSEVAHDFGNLMTVMLGYSELLLAAAGPAGYPQSGSPEREYLAELHRAAERASALTTQLLGYSRRSADPAGPLDLSAVVRGLAVMLGRLLGSVARLEVSAPAGLGFVQADVKQVEQVVVNLVLNARDAVAPGGHVAVEVESARLTAPLTHALGTAAPGDYVLLRVRDNGCGMGPETLEQLFRPFFTTKGRGTGLGLTIVARIARASGAAVTVQSEVGRGTTFEVYFPRLPGSKP